MYSVIVKLSLQSYECFLIYGAAKLTVEVFSTCTSVLGIPALRGRCSGLWTVRHIVLRTECTQEFGHIWPGLSCMDTALMSSSPTPSLYPSINEMNVHLQNEPLSRGFLRRREKKFMAVVQHKGEKTYVSCRRQGPFLYFLLQGLHDGSNPDVKVTVPICPFHQKPELVTLWLFPPLLSFLWKCGFLQFILYLRE